MSDLRFLPNHRRIRVGLDALMKDFYDAKHPFTEGVMDFPQQSANLPPDLPRGGLEEANYWLWMCHYMLGATDSMTMARKLAFNLYPRYPQLFNQDHLATLKPASITPALHKAELGFRSSEGEIPSAAVENAKRINERWDGDIRNAFVEAGGDWRKLHKLLIASKRKGGLVGYGPKMAGMLAFYLMRQQIVPYFPMPPQVDFHVMRVFWACNFVVPCKTSGEQVTVLKNHKVTEFGIAIQGPLYSYILETDCNWLDLSDALWTQSREMCRHSPSNLMRRDEEGDVLKEPIKWTPVVIQKYQKSCGQCSLSAICTNAIPQAPYYSRKATMLIAVGPREEPPYADREMF